MKQILYLTMAPIDESSGVYKKIIAQADAYTNLGFECKVLFVRDTENAFLRSDSGEIKELSLDDSKDISVVLEYIDSCEFCYARFELLRHKYYRKIISICKGRKLKVVTEIPTYPPYQESIARVKKVWHEGRMLSAVKTLIGSLCVIIDMYIMTIYSNLMVLVADDKKFLFSRTLRIENGIDLSKNPYQPKGKGDILKIIAVSNFSIWNGYDRAIAGLKNYIDNTGRHDIKLIMVGDTKAGKILIDQAEGLGIINDIQFTGALSGAKLDEAYANADIALAALGNHRRKVFANSSLKAKEYASRGMIMVLSDAEGIEHEIKKRSLIVRSDETPLDFLKIRDWYDKLTDIAAMREFTHQFAIEHYSWESQISKVIANI